MRFLLLTASMLGPVLLFSQKFDVPSTIITRTRDSIQVLTQKKQEVGFSNIQTKNPSSKQIRIYRPSEIYGITIGSDNYISSIVSIDQTPYNEEVTLDSNTFKSKTDTVLLKVEYVGSNIELFSLSTSKRIHFFVQKDKGPIGELIYRKMLINRNGTDFESEDKKFLIQLNDLLADCPQVAGKINDISYSVQSIEAVLDSYSRTCRKGTAASYTKVYKTKFEISVFAGTSLLSFSYNDASGFNGTNTKLQFSSGPTPLIGARFNYIPPILNGKFAILADLYFNNFKASNSYYSNYINDSFYTRQTIQLKDAYVNLGVVVQYYFLPGKTRV